MIQRIHPIEKYPKYCRTWQESGASSESEYQDFIHDACGIACIRTMLAFYHKTVPKPIVLRKRARELNLYTENGLMLKKAAPLFKDFQLKTKYHSHPSLKKLGKLVLKAPIIASIKGPESGHLVVIYGVENDESSFFYYYDSVEEKEIKISQTEWQKISNGRALQVL